MSYVEISFATEKFPDAIEVSVNTNKPVSAVEGYDLRVGNCLKIPQGGDKLGVVAALVNLATEVGRGIDVISVHSDAIRVLCPDVVYTYAVEDLILRAFRESGVEVDIKVPEYA